MPHSPVADWIKAMPDEQLCAAVSLIVHPKDPVSLHGAFWRRVPNPDVAISVLDYLRPYHFAWLLTFAMQSGFAVSFRNGMSDDGDTLNVTIRRNEESNGTEGVIHLRSRPLLADCMKRAFLEAIAGYHESWIKFTGDGGTNTIAEAT